MRATGQALALGTRVRIAAPQAGLKLRSSVGTVARPDDDDYYVIRLDEPALYDRGLGGKPEELPEIIELVDNLEILDEHERGVSPIGDEYFESRIRQWLEEEGFEIEPADARLTRFHIRAHEADGLTVDVYRPEGKTDQIVMATMMTLDQVFWKKKIPMGKKAERLGLDMQLELLRIGIGHDNVWPPFQHMTLQMVVFDEMFSKHAVLHGLFLIRRARRLISVLARRHILM